MELLDFKSAENTIVVSDIHLADAEEHDPRRPLWKRFKRREHFVDEAFKSFLEYIRTQATSPAELVLNGDIFDFDSVMAIPTPQSLGPSVKISWLEKIRGLNSEEAKSRFKIGVILDTHPVWVEAIRSFILEGHRVVFVIGNHDLELHWPSVRQDILSRFNLPGEKISSVRFCEWFYISNQDTLIEHGNQYDAYCLCSNPIHPLIKKGSRILVRTPFGNLAGKFMINGMGLMNPHATGHYIKSSVWGYITFYYRYMIKTQPFLLWTWFWSAFATLIYSVTEGLLPALSDPLTVDARLEDIARRSNSSVWVVLALKEVHAHPAIYNPIKILRELWLDRAILLGFIIFGSFQFFSVLNVFAHVSLWWFVIPLALLIPIFIFYARSVQSEVNATQNSAMEMASLSARITKVKRIVQGHTHDELHRILSAQSNQDKDEIEILNTGTWSPAYQDVECSKPYGRKCFAWIRPQETSSQRMSQLYEWTGTKAVLIPPT
jgi:UDP-2,3-diacylglucosamine pyrophosphatase LpxH